MVADVRLVTPWIGMISFDAEAVTQLEQERALTTLKMLSLA